MSRFPPAKVQPCLRGIEALRAAAALAVVAYHVAGMLAAGPGRSAPMPLQNGAAGVDVFFVISGFVMVVSARRLADWPNPAWRFACARLRRIVPLYWFCTAAKILAVLALPSLGRGTLNFGYCAASLLFLPLQDAGGGFKPVIAAGWTLSFEMMFYALFAAALAASRPPALAVPPLLLAAYLLLPLAGPVAGELGNPIVLEFAFGTSLAALWVRGWRLPSAVAWIMLVVATGLLAEMPKLALGSRALSWGIPASCLVAATVSLETRLGPRLPNFVLSLGAASYAIYLTHGFVLAAIGKPIGEITLPGHATLLVLPVCLLACAAAGWAVHVGIEKALLGRGKNRTRPKPAPVVLVLAGGGLTPTSGGVGTLMRNLIENWAAMQAAPQVRVVDTRGQGSVAGAALRFTTAFCLVGVLCATRRVSLIHAHMTTRGSAARKALLCGLAMTMGVKVIVHMHGADFMPFHRRLHPVFRWPLDAVLRRSRLVVVVGSEWRRFLVEEVRISADRITVLPNGVPLPGASARQADAAPRILFLGRLCARKGVPDLIAALGQPALRAKAWHATIAGDGNAAPYRAMLGWHGLQGRVSLPGWTETGALLAQADILVLPSHHEAMPLAVIEALAASVAVITTPVGAIPEFLRHGASALLVSPGAPAELAAAILLLLENAGLRADIARAGHAVFRERLEIGQVAARLADIYAQAAG